MDEKASLFLCVSGRVVLFCFFACIAGSVFLIYIKKQIQVNGDEIISNMAVDDSISVYLQEPFQTQMNEGLILKRAQFLLSSLSLLSTTSLQIPDNVHNCHFVAHLHVNDWSLDVTMMKMW